MTGKERAIKDIENLKIRAGAVSLGPDLFFICLWEIYLILFS